MLHDRGYRESNHFAIFELYRIGSNVLGNTTGFTGNNIGMPDMVEQGCFTMVNVTHNGNDRSTAF
jgi:hypothetical protein